jgi:hypothetical protein
MEASLAACLKGVEGPETNNKKHGLLQIYSLYVLTSKNPVCRLNLKLAWEEGVGAGHVH